MSTDPPSDIDDRRDAPETVPHQAQLVPAISAIVLSLGIISVGITAYFIATGGEVSEPPAGVLYGLSGIGLAVAVGMLWWYLDSNQRLAAFPLHRPSRTELGWTLVCFPFGLAAFLAGERVGILLGGEPLDVFAYDVTALTTLAGVLFGAIVIAPIAEELLYRGVLISALQARGWSALAAGLGSIGVFAVSHVFVLGLAGAFAIAAWAVFPTVLRLRFDNLAGAWLLHFLNNATAYLIVVLLFG